MDIAKQHWPILRELGTELANRVRSFMVVGKNGNGVMVVTQDGEGYWLGTITFGMSEMRTSNEPIPLNVPGLVQMAQGDSHILLLTETGQIYAMGKNNRGQLGLGKVNQETHFLPQLIFIPYRFSSVRCGHNHSVALTEDGKVWAWRRNYYGQVGVPESNPIFSSPRQILELDPHRVVSVECGGDFSLALTDQGEIYDWGIYYWEKFGNGSGISKHTFIQIPSLSPFKSMAAGISHTLLLTQNGEVYAYGSNKHSQLGLPTTTTEFSASLVKVEGLPSISQIASHHSSTLSIAMSSDHRCFVWGLLSNRKSISTPRELPSDYSTVESPISFYSFYSNTTHSVSVPEPPPNRLSSRLSRIFDNPETSSDVQFVVEQRTIHAHRNILSYSSDYFARMFSERWMAPVNPNDPIVKVTIPDNSYEVFHTFLRFLYTDSLEVHSKHLSELFVLANQYLESNLQQLCIRRMRDTLTTATCCLYYQLTHRISLPELDVFQQELVQYASTRMSEIANTESYQSMESVVRENLTYAIGNLLGTLICHFECHILKFKL